jgi:ribosomal protein S18
MPTINDILNWTLPSSTFKHNGDRIIHSKTKSGIKDSIKRINQLISELPDGGTAPDSKRLKDIYFQFLHYLDDSEIVFSRRDTRMLLWALDYIPENDKEAILYSDNLKVAIELIKKNWRDSFLITLWHLLLKNWNTLLKYSNQKKLISKILKDKLKKYNMSRKDILNLSKNIKLFVNNNSPYLYALEIIDNGYSIDKAHELIKQKESILLYEFFSEVVLSYIEIIDDFSEFELTSTYDFLRFQNSRRSKLLLCSSIINGEKYGRLETIVKSRTLNIIGDPVKEHLWRFNKLTDRESIEVEKARKKLNVMLNKQFIKVFFEKLVPDPRRKNYWMKFIDKIEDIKFVGNRNNYDYLKSIESISKFVDSRYRIMNSRADTCSLIIYSRGFVFTEFTDTGALYIYQNNSFNINLNSVSKIADLKLWPTSKFACKNSANHGYVDLNREGRITHQGDWESRFNNWMREYYD